VTQKYVQNIELLLSERPKINLSLSFVIIKLEYRNTDSADFAFHTILRSYLSRPPGSSYGALAAYLSELSDITVHPSMNA
jgi:hypothetical protein